MFRVRLTGAGVAFAAVSDVIRTPRLDLRPLRAGDLDVLAALYADPTTMQYLGGGETATREETAQWLLDAIAAHERRGYGMVAFERRDDGVVVGRGGYKWWQVEGKDHLEIGWLVDPSCRRSGYATEAGAGLRDHAFDVLDQDHVISVIRAENVASIRVAEKVGERYWRDWTTPGAVRVRLYRVDRS